MKKLIILTTSRNSGQISSQKKKKRLRNRLKELMWQTRRDYKYCRLPSTGSTTVCLQSALSFQCFLAVKFKWLLCGLQHTTFSTDSSLTLFGRLVLELRILRNMPRLSLSCWLSYRRQSMSVMSQRLFFLRNSELSF